MKSPTDNKIPPRSTPQVHHIGVDGSLPLPVGEELDADMLFLLHIAKLLAIETG